MPVQVMATLAQERLAQERKDWRKNRPFGFAAKPVTRDDGSVDMLTWTCSVPGKAGTPWEGGSYPVTLEFPSEYPNKPPVAKFKPGFYHMNVYPDGKVCLSILDDDDELCGQWSPSITLTQILTGIQELLTNPNPHSPANPKVYDDWKKSPGIYEKFVKTQVAMYPPGADV
uniref:UBC core domain-containing protein n=1 Tax=Chlamydomonas leiostraca TaxID=1034604 RepID=A0A7S0R6L9_9CHLO|mmetsp:Transcript_14777/g.36873  ORF Transcript_14777/g.36873 Transcript_14777/m.36873 type:complete len:171 (+) Transcript_14777:56-568(+)|eukprot:CAMPEP_0202868362 /NCGR_PEP_ID=MMETSP1391-20130828/10839_1 /ASSEMBLY_ACC=CAM_ASM_000867 /TAXON_ID=1034604 /ORGANISM="Chlamydomonas leiostraca, Strain SAG 11-49" /LENGTH=170 /DNA_ID=CAMNT_0049548527 /DNA_START=52 /DNA_END=564 /DNA_ORIENTATION=+